MESSDVSKLSRDFWDGILSIRSALDDYAVPTDIVDDLLDTIEGEILDALSHAGEASEEDDEDGE